MTQVLLGAILLGAFAYAALLLIAWRFGDRLILPAPASTYRRGMFETLHTIRTTDGVELAAVHLPNDRARYTILYSHGNGEDLGNVLPVLEMIHALGFAVYAYDYRGYGASGGSANVEGVLLDVEAAYAHVTGPLGVSPDRLILWGRSVGGGPTVHLAAMHPAAAMVLEATFTSAFCVMTHRAILPFDRLCNLKLLADIRLPVLFIHGRRDRVVPFSHGPRLFAGAAEPKWHVWVDEAGHNDLWLVAPDRIAAGLRALVDALSDSSAARSESHPRRSPPERTPRRSA